MELICASEFPELTGSVIRIVHQHASDTVHWMTGGAGLRAKRLTETADLMTSYREAPIGHCDFADDDDIAVGIWRLRTCRATIERIKLYVPLIAYEFGIATGMCDAAGDRYDPSPAWARRYGLSSVVDVAGHAVAACVMCAPDIELGPFGRHERALDETIHHLEQRVLESEDRFSADSFWDFLVAMSITIGRTDSIVDQHWSLPQPTTELFLDLAVLASTGVVTLNEDRLRFDDCS